MTDDEAVQWASFRYGISVEMIESAGLIGSDAATAARAYVDGHPMTAAEAQEYRKMPAHERAAVLAARYGSDGGRVAAIVVASTGRT